MQQNRPVILELNYQGDVGYVILYAVGNDKVEVSKGRFKMRDLGTAEVVPEHIARRWAIEMCGGRG